MGTNVESKEDADVVGSVGAVPEESFETPYPRSPGGGTPGPEVTPKEGTRELWSFFWLSVLNSAIIAVAGVTAWFFVH